MDCKEISSGKESVFANKNKVLADKEEDQVSNKTKSLFLGVKSSSNSSGGSISIETSDKKISKTSE